MNLRIPSNLGGTIVGIQMPWFIFYANIIGKKGQVDSFGAFGLLLIQPDSESARYKLFARLCSMMNH